jgi:hypothetical protein
MMHQAVLTLRLCHRCHSCITVGSPYINKHWGRLLLVVFCIGKASAKLHKSDPTLKRLNLLGLQDVRQLSL